MDIRTLIFDVLGTVVDERGSIAAEIAHVVDDPDLARRVAAEWERRLDVLMDEVRAGALPCAHPGTTCVVGHWTTR